MMCEYDEEIILFFLKEVMNKSAPSLRFESGKLGEIG